MSEPLRYPELPPELAGGFNLRLLKYFGAGAIIASVTIGSGETFFASRGGAVFGYTLLWCFLGSALMKGVQVYGAARYMTLTGEHPMAHWKFLPGPRGWVPAMMGLISIACFPFWLAGLPLFIGKTLNWIFGVTGGDAELIAYARMWGTLCIVLAVTLTWFQSYGVLEKVQTFIVGVLLASIFAATFASRPDWLAALAGTFTPRIPDYDPWIVEKYSEIASTPRLVEVGLYLGAIGGGTYDYLGYIGCYREKKWGLIGAKRHRETEHETEAIATSAETLPIDTSPENVARARAWLWPAKIDVGVAFLCVLLFTMCFVVLGATILRPAHLVPEGNDLLTHQANFLTQFHPALLYLYQIGIFMAFWGTIYGAYEIYLRTAYECLMPLSARLRAMPIKTFRGIVLTYCATGGLALLWTTSDPVKLVAPAAIIGGVLTCGLWCFAMIWVDHRFLPPPLRMGGLLLTLTVISGVVLTLLGAQATYDYVMELVETFTAPPPSG